MSNYASYYYSTVKKPEPWNGKTWTLDLSIGTRRLEELDQWHGDELGGPARVASAWELAEAGPEGTPPCPRVAARGPGQLSQRMLRFATWGVATNHNISVIIFLYKKLIILITGWVSLKSFVLCGQMEQVYNRDFFLYIMH